MAAACPSLEVSAWNISFSDYRYISAAAEGIAAASQCAAPAIALGCEFAEARTGLMSHAASTTQAAGAWCPSARHEQMPCTTPAFGAYQDHLEAHVLHDHDLYGDRTKKHYYYFVYFQNTAGSVTYSTPLNCCKLAAPRRTPLLRNGATAIAAAITILTSAMTFSRSR